MLIIFFVVPARFLVSNIDISPVMTDLPETEGDGFWDLSVQAG